MRIVVCHPGKQHVNALLTALDRRGCLVRFYTMLAANNLPGLRFFPEKWRAQFQKFAYKAVDERRLAHFPALFFLLKLMRSEYWSVRLPYAIYDRWTAWRLSRTDYDIVIGYENSTLNTFTAAKKAGKITVLDLTGLHHDFQVPILTAAGVYKSLDEVRFISKKKETALAVTDHVTTLSKLAQRELVRAGFPADRIHVTYLGLDQSIFIPKKGYRTEATGPLNLYFVGTMSRLKGLPFLTELVKELRWRGLDLFLTLIGSVDDFDPNELDKNWCRHIPFVSHAELAGLHHGLDLFVFPSYTDSWGMAVVEAMGCGSPVLVSANTGSQDAVEQGGGAVLPVDDREAWMAAIERFYHDRYLLKTIGEEAARIAKRYSWEAYHEQVFKAMEKIYEAGGRAIENGQTPDASPKTNPTGAH